MSVFLTIKETATRSGLSQFYIRNRCKDGTIPHRMMGIKYMVDYEASAYASTQLCKRGYYKRC